MGYSENIHLCCSCGYISVGEGGGGSRNTNENPNSIKNKLNQVNLTILL